MDFDPQNLDPTIFLTAAGATVAAGILAGLVQSLKRLPGFGPWLDAGKEVVISMVGAAGLVAVGFSASGAALDLVTGFAAFLAWLNISLLAGKAYDIAPDSLKSALGGTSKK